MFWFNDVNSPEDFISDIQIDGKCLICGVWQSSLISPMFGTLFILKQYDNILSDNSWPKKVGKFVKTRKFDHHRLNHSFFRILFSKNFLMKSYRWPLNSAGKIVLLCSIKYQEMFAMMTLVFRENAKNRQNYGVFEGAVIGVNSFVRFLFL